MSPWQVSIQGIMILIMHKQASRLWDSERHPGDFLLFSYHLNFQVLLILFLMLVVVYLKFVDYLTRSKNTTQIRLPREYPSYL